jgi:phage baseplate assembly protein gpV
VCRNWANAVNDCAGATTGGFTDWALPTANELRSLLDQTLASPAINGTAFPGTPGAANSNFWSSTPDASNNTFAWWVDFSLGTTGSYSKTAFSNYVRCVRNRPAPPGTRYTVNSTDGTVLDNATGLTWQQSLPTNAVNWESAAAQCATPWRLPTTSELFTLLDLSRQSPALDPVFPGVTTECFWTSVPSTTMGFAWRVCFDHGRAAEWDIAATHRVRCVQ